MLDPFPRDFNRHLVDRHNNHFSPPRALPPRADTVVAGWLCAVELLALVRMISNYWGTRSRDDPFCEEPMPARIMAALPPLADGQAQYVLRRLIENGTVNSKDVSAVAAQIENEIESLEQQIRMLRQTSRGLERLSNGSRRQRQRSIENGNQERSSQARRRRRKLNLSPERRVNLQLQGHYLALMRRTPKSQRDHYKKVFRQDGLQAAIMAMESRRAAFNSSSHADAALK